MTVKIIDDPGFKVAQSSHYNFLFNKTNGYFARWGRIKEEDPLFAPAPEILDIEVSEICSKGCTACYKDNTKHGRNMSFDTFKIILDKMSKSGLLCQLAFGIGDIRANLDLFKMAAYARKKGIIPNITINGEGMSSSYYNSLAKYMGAVAVSRYNKDACYTAVKELTNRGMTQVNIHMLLSADTIEECFKVIQESKTDVRLKKLNSIVFLMLKPKGRGRCCNQLKNATQYKKLIDYAMETNTRIGFDSCGAAAFMKTIEDHPNRKEIEQSVESCESSLFSSYCNVEGKFYPCSFAEGTEGWEEGLDIVNCNNFVEEIWDHHLTVKFRKSLLKTQIVNKHNCRECPIYNLEIS